MTAISCTSRTFTQQFQREFDQWKMSESTIGKRVFIIRDFSHDKITFVFKRQENRAIGELPCPTEKPSYRVYIAPFQEGEKIREIFNRELNQEENPNSTYGYYSVNGDKVEFDLNVQQKLSAVLNQVYQPA